MADWTQEDMVLDYLQKHKSGMTSKMAYDKFGIMQMPKRILTLRRKGYAIKSIPKTVKNRWGKTCHIVVYTLQGRLR